MEKEKKISDGTTELIIGNTILLCNDFADGMVLMCYTERAVDKHPKIW